MVLTNCERQKFIYHNTTTYQRDSLIYALLFHMDTVGVQPSPLTTQFQTTAEE